MMATTAARNAVSSICFGHIDRIALRVRYVCVSVRSALGTSTCARRRIVPKRARTQLRGRPISEKALVILECEEAFENTELFVLNGSVHLLDGRGEL